MPVPSVSANRSRDIDEEHAIRARAALKLSLPEEPGLLDNISQLSHRFFSMPNAPEGAPTVPAAPAPKQTQRDQAAVRLQATHRGRSGRIEVEIKSEHKRLSAGAPAKGNRAKQQAAAKGTKLRAPPSPQEQQAATKLQALQRGRSGRQLQSQRAPDAAHTKGKGTQGRRAAEAHDKEVQKEQWAKKRAESEKLRQEQEAAQRAADAISAHEAARGAALRQAASEGDADECRRLIGDGIDPESADAEGRTALHMAALGDHTEAILVLLDEGIDIDLQDARGRTAVSVAAGAGQVEALCTLVDDGADAELPAARSALNWSPIMFAAANGHADAIGVLLNTSPDLIDYRDAKGRTAADIASETGHEEAEDALFLAADSRGVEQSKKEAAEKKRVLKRGDSKAALLRTKTNSRRDGLRGRKAASFKLSDTDSPPSSQAPSPYSQLQGGFRSVAFAGRFLSKMTGLLGGPQRQSQSLPTTPEDRKSTSSGAPSALKRGMTRMFTRGWPTADARASSRASPSRDESAVKQQV